MRLDGKTALVTGAGSGIGRAMADRLSAEGAGVMCADVNEEGAQTTAARIAERGGRATAMRLDVTVESEVRAALERTFDELGGLDALLNNAGIGVAEWDRTIAVNLSGVYYGLLHGAHFMARHGGGAIVNTASIAGLTGFPLRDVNPAEVDEPPTGAAPYVTAKHGVVGLTRQFGVMYAPFGVRVNAVAPGFVDTPMIANRTEDAEARRQTEELHPMRRLGRPEEIAAAAAFLVSDDASYITGAILPVDGGYSAQ